MIAVDVETAKLDLARELGADHVVNARTTDPVAAIEALGGADVAVVLAVIPAGRSSRPSPSLRRGGRLVCVGLPPRRRPDVAADLRPVLKGISVIGSIVGTRQDLAEVFALHAAGPDPRRRRDPQARRGQRLASSEVLAGRRSRPAWCSSSDLLIRITRRSLVARHLQQGIVRD